VTEAKRRPLAIHAGAKRLIEILLTKPELSLADAAKEAQLATTSARTYLGRPHVIRYLREQKAAMLEAARVGNIPALVKVRSDGSNQMAVVAACRQLESMGQTIAEEASHQIGSRPGLQIVIHMPGGEQRIVSGPQRPALSEPAPMIDATPIEEGA
jgi:hypothetical protein